MMKTLTKSEVAALFHVSLRTIELWVQSNRLPAPRKVGRRVLWNEQDVLALLKSDQEGVTHG